MTAERKPQTPKEKARAHRERMRLRGLRPVQFWLPDVRTPEFAAEARRQALLIAQSPQEQEDIEFVESISSEFKFE